MVCSPFWQSTFRDPFTHSLIRNVIAGGSLPKSDQIWSGHFHHSDYFLLWQINPPHGIDDQAARNPITIFEEM